MKVLVCGDRNWSEEAPIRRELEKLPSGTMIIHGAARGADTLAEKVARDLGLPFMFFPAQWELFGKAAGPIRNMKMLACDPDLVMAFHKDIDASKGTKHMVGIAKARGIKTEVFKK